MVSQAQTCGQKISYIAYLFLDNSNWLRNENNVKVIGIKQVIFHQTNLSCNRY